MHQCLRCALPQAETSLFCDRCQAALLSRYQQKESMANKSLSLACQESAHIREPELLKLPMRTLNPSQQANRIDQSETLRVSEEIPAMRPRYNPVLLKRLRIACAVMVILAVVSLAVDSILALDVMTHKSGNAGKARSAPHTLSSIPPVIPIHVTPERTSTAAQTSGITDEVIPGEATSSAANPLTGQSGPSQGGEGPILAVSSNTLSFSLIQGQANPPGQIVTIVNTGVGAFDWQMASTNPSWLTLSAAKGSIAAGQSGQIWVNIAARSLAPGTYAAQLSIMATDSAGKETQGSPKTISVSLAVFQPCTLQVSPTSLSFTGTTLQLSSSTQTFSLKAVGRCAQPVTWFAKVDSGSQKWLSLSSTSGHDDGSGSTITVSIDTNGMLPGNYTGQISCSATASGGSIVQSSPQLIAVTMDVKLAGAL